MIIWNGMDIICLVILGICAVLFVLAWLWFTIQDKIDKHFERKNKNDR